MNQVLQALEIAWNLALWCIGFRFVEVWSKAGWRDLGVTCRFALATEENSATI